MWNTLRISSDPVLGPRYKLTPNVATATELPAHWVKNYTYFPIINNLTNILPVINAKTDLPIFSLTDTLRSEAVQLSPNLL